MFKDFILRYKHSQTKRNSLKTANFFCLCAAPILASGESFLARNQNLAGSFNNISFNLKFWTKYNIVIHGVNYFIFDCSNSRRKSGVPIFKVSPGDGE